MNSPQEIRIGSELMRGGQHNAAMVITVDGEFPQYPQVVKWPHTLGKWESCSPHDARNDLAILADLPVKIPQTQIYDDVLMYLDGDSTRAPYLMVQEFISGHEVTESDLALPTIQHDIRAALLASWNMYREKGMAIDFLGQKAIKGFVDFFRNPACELTIHNFVRTPQDEAILIDTRLFVPGRLSPGVNKIITLFTELAHFAIARILSLYLPSSEHIHLEGGDGKIRKLTDALVAASRARKRLAGR